MDAIINKVNLYNITGAHLTRKSIAAVIMRQPCSAPQLRRELMNPIELIITCENCGHVEHQTAYSENESTRLIDKFSCPGQCSPKFYSYITSELRSFETIRKPEQVAHVA